MATTTRRGRKSHEAGRRVKTLDQLTRMFDEQIEEIRAQAKVTPSGEVERFKHCIDKESFGGRFYCPSLVVSSFGRVWNLEKRCFSKLSRKRYPHGYFQIGVSKNAEGINPNAGHKVYVHKLVANYYIDLDHEQRNMILELEDNDENNIIVHHKMKFKPNADDYSINKWSNLQYISRETHDQLHELCRDLLIQDPEERERQLSNLKLVLDDPASRMHVMAWQMEYNKYNQLNIYYKRDESGKPRSHLSTKLLFGKGRPKDLPVLDE